MSLPTLRLAPLPTDKALPGSAHIPSVATGVRPHTKRSKIGDRVPVHVGTWYAPIGIVLRELLHTHLVVRARVRQFNRTVYSMCILGSTS